MNLEPRLLTIEEEDWLNTFQKKIKFYTFTFFKPSADSKISTLRFYISTKDRPPRQDVIDHIRKEFNNLCRVNEVWDGWAGRTYDVWVPNALRVDTFIWKICKALEDLL